MLREIESEAPPDDFVHQVKLFERHFDGGLVHAASVEEKLAGSVSHNRRRVAHQGDENTQLVSR